MAYDKPYELRPNSGSLFAKKSKTKPMSPDYFGEILIDLSAFQVQGNQIKVSLSGWKKVSANGKQYLSLAASAPREETQSRAYGGDNHQSSSVDDGDCPF